MLWIVGSNGFLGRELKKQCPEAFATGREVDVCNPLMIRAYIQNKKITHIANCVAFSNVDAAEQENREAFKLNTVAPENLAQLSVEIGAQLIHVSTDYVFDGENTMPYKESDKTNPINAYGRTKLEGEKRVLKIAPNSLIIRTSSLFGNGGKNFVTKLRTMFEIHRDILLANDTWSKVTYVPDLVKAIMQMLGKTGVYHFANQGVIDKYTFGLAMKEYLGSKTTVSPAPSAFFVSPCKRPVYSALDTEKIENHIAIRPWQNALQEFLCEPLPVSS